MERICSFGSKFFPLKVDPFYKGFFSKGFVRQASNRMSQNLFPFVKLAEKWMCTPTKYLMQLMTLQTMT